MSLIHVVKADIRIRLPIACSACGLQAFSLPIAVEFEDVEPGMIPRILEWVPLGTAFPAGWAKYRGISQDWLVCPACPHP